MLSTKNSSLIDHYAEHTRRGQAFDTGQYNNVLSPAATTNGVVRQTLAAASTENIWKPRSGRVTVTPRLLPVTPTHDEASEGSVDCALAAGVRGLVTISEGATRLVF